MAEAPWEENWGTQTTTNTPKNPWEVDWNAEQVAPVQQEQTNLAPWEQPWGQEAPTSVTPEPIAPQEVESNIFREAADIPLQIAKGATYGVRAITEAFGADNELSQILRGVEDYVDSLLSAQSKADSAEIARIQKEAEDAGAWDQVKAAVRGISIAPIDFMANAVGTVIPTLATGLLATAFAPAGATAAATAATAAAVRTAAGIGTGAVMGAGIGKGAIYDAVKDEMLKQGLTEEQAESAADEAQSYSGENLDQIALGTILGGWAAKSGLEPALARMLSTKAAEGVAKKGILKGAVSGAVTEAIPEAAQGGQEQLARNIALQREGVDVPTMRGVVGAGTLEGLAGGMAGAGVGAVEARAANTRRADKPRTRPEWTPVVSAYANMDMGKTEEEIYTRVGEVIADFGNEAATAYLSQVYGVEYTPTAEQEVEVLKGPGQIDSEPVELVSQVLDDVENSEWLADLDSEREATFQAAAELEEVGAEEVEAASIATVPADDMFGFDVPAATQDTGFEPTRNRLMAKLNQTGAQELDFMLREAGLQVTGAKEQKIERLIAAREAFDLLTENGEKKYESAVQISQAIQSGEINAEDAARLVNAISVGQKSRTSYVAADTNANALAALIGRLKPSLAVPFRTEAEEAAFQAEREPAPVALGEEAATARAREDEFFENSRLEFLQFWEQATPSDRLELLQAAGAEGNTAGKTSRRVNAKTINALPNESKVLLREWAPDNWNTFKTSPRTGTAVPTAKLGRPVGTGQQSDTAVELRKQQDKERQQLGRAPTALAATLEMGEQKILDKRVARNKTIKFSDYFPTIEEFNQYTNNQQDAYDTEVKGLKLQYATEGVAPEAAQTRAQVDANQKQIAANLLSDELQKLKAKRVKQLEKVIAIATDTKLEGKAAHTAALDVLNDPNIDPQERALAEDNVAATKAKQKPLGAIPAKTGPTPMFIGEKGVENLREQIEVYLLNPEGVVAPKIVPLDTALSLLGDFEDAAPNMGREALRRNTGWFEGIDNKWRIEISDEAGQFILPLDELVESPSFGTPTIYKLRDVYSHPLLYEIYPEAANIDFVYRPAFMDFFSATQGSYDGKNQIQVTPYAEDASSTLLHEIQHWVQQTEGFAEGGNERSAVNAIMDTFEAEEIIGEVSEAIQAKLEKINAKQDAMYKVAASIPDVMARIEGIEEKKEALRETYGSPAWMETDEGSALQAEEKAIEQEIKNVLGLPESLFRPGIWESAEREVLSDLTSGDYKKRAERLVEEQNQALEQLQILDSNDKEAVSEVIVKSGQAFDLYRRLAGEVEARNIQTRRLMTVEERLANPPEETEDIDDDDQIIVIAGNTLYPPATVTELLNVPETEGLATQEPLFGAIEEVETAAEAADTIIIDPNRTPFERGLARVLKPVLQRLGTTFVIVKDPAQITNPNIVEIWATVDGKQISAGVFDPTNNVIYVDEVEGLQPRVVLHEMIHAATVYTLRRYFKNKELVSENARAAIDSMIDDGRDDVKTPEYPQGRPTGLKSIKFDLQQLSKNPNPDDFEQQEMDRLGKLLQDREEVIDEVFDLFDKMKALGGGSTAVELYSWALQEYRNDFEEQYSLLLNSIRSDTTIEGTENDDASPKGKLMADIVASYQEARTRKVYAPLMRFGDWGVRVNPGSKDTAFYMFKNEAQQIQFMNFYQDQNPYDTVVAVNLNQEGRSFRDEMIADTERLRSMFNQIDALSQGNAEVADELKDSIYQIYLLTLPEGNMRKKYLRRKGRLGFDNDAFRALVTTKLSNINQLSRMKYGKDIRNAISEGREALKGSPTKFEISRDPKKYKGEKPKESKEAILNEVALRATTELAPPVLKGWAAGFDRFTRLGTKSAFVWLMSAPSSALIQPTQLAMFGFGVLHAEFGAGKTAAMAAKYIKNFLTMQALTRTKAGENGEIENEKGQAAIRNSKYVNGSKIKSPLQKAWDIANLQNTFGASLTQDVLSLRDPEEIQARAERGPIARGVSRPVDFAVKMMTGATQLLERVSREVFFMSAFELAYEQALKAGATGDSAIEAAAYRAIKLTDKAMFDYSNQNKPRIAKTSVGRMAYQFQTYRIQATGYLIKNGYNAIFNSDLSPDEKRKAGVMFFDSLAMNAISGGLTATLGYTAFVALVDGIREALRPEYDDEDEDGMLYDMTDPNNPFGLRSFDLYVRGSFIPRYFGAGSSLAKLFGLEDETARLLARSVEVGPISALTDWNIQSRLSFDAMWFTDYGQKPDLYSAAIEQSIFDIAVGPFGSVLKNMADGAQMMLEGEIYRGVEKMSPGFVKEPMEAYRLSQEGYVTAGGNRYAPADYYDAWRLTGQTLGFGSTELARSQKAIFAYQELKQEAKDNKTELYNAIEEAATRNLAIRTEYGPDSKQAARAKARLDDVVNDIRAHNYKYFYNAIKWEDLNASLQEKMRRAGLTKSGLYLGDAEAPYLYPLIQDMLLQPTMKEIERMKDTETE
jgi:hypothetical protein